MFDQKQFLLDVSFFRQSLEDVILDPVKFYSESLSQADFDQMQRLFVYTLSLTTLVSLLINSFWETALLILSSLAIVFVNTFVLTAIVRILEAERKSVVQVALFTVHTLATVEIISALTVIPLLPDVIVMLCSGFASLWMAYYGLQHYLKFSHKATLIIGAIPAFLLVSSIFSTLTRF